MTTIRNLAAAVAAVALTAGAAPYEVAPGLFQASKPDLGLSSASGAETFTVFAPTEGSDKFSNGVVLIPFKGRLYAQWQSSARDEDSADTWVAYAVSDDGPVMEGDLLLAQFEFRNRVQPIGLLLRQRELAIEFQIVEVGDPENVHKLLFAPHH